MSASPPLGWVRAYWPEEVITLLKSGQVTELSLDHDLGDDAHGTGYTVLLWLEEQVALHNFQPPCNSRPFGQQFSPNQNGGRYCCDWTTGPRIYVKEKDQGLHYASGQ